VDAASPIEAGRTIFTKIDETPSSTCSVADHVMPFLRLTTLEPKVMNASS
jgi:hypothetical protein